MKIVKRILYVIFVLFALFCGLVILCAFKPEVTEKIAHLLYSNKNVTTTAQKNSGAEDGTKSSEESAILADADVVSVYVPPQQSEISVPEQVSGKNGYQPIQNQSEQVGEETARQLKQQLGTGETGDELAFDAAFYPYYAMLDERGQHLYRQICANANALIGSFAPVEDIAVGELKNVFLAVCNDHPEIFWLDTVFYCKYREGGQCVEMDLQFNRTTVDLQAAKNDFNENANLIIAEAQNLGSSYEKEKFVHDALIDKVSYNMGAEMNQSAYSALVNGETVCAGYARAYQYLMQQLGVPCYCCTGFAGESHAWNIVALEDGYYNVDATWDDTDGGTYDYFNKTDEDYRTTHIRQELSVNLPPCNGQLYRETEPSEEQETNLRSLADVGMTEEDVLYSLSEYQNDCYNQIVAAGQGTYTFNNVIDGEALLMEIDAAYTAEDAMKAYMDNAVQAVDGSYYEVYFMSEELQGQRYLMMHKVTIR